MSDLPKKVGQPSKKTTERIAALLRLTQEGKTEKEIAKIIGVNTSTIFRWKQWDPDLCIAINELKHEADQAVEASLFKRALGFEKTYITEKATKDGAVEVKETQYYPPDPTSMVFWLKNRDQNRWKDRREEDHKVLMVKQEIITTLSNEELLEETKRLVSKLEAIHVQGKASQE